MCKGNPSSNCFTYDTGLTPSANATLNEGEDPAYLWSLLDYGECYSACKIQSQPLLGIVSYNINVILFSLDDNSECNLDKYSEYYNNYAL